MDSSILLLCKYGSLTLVVKVARGFKFEDLVASICKKWNNLVSRRLHLLYVVSEHSNCLLENDDDFDSMVALAVAYGVSCVEVSVNEGGSSSRVDHSNSSEIVECSTLQIDEDPLEKFCPHHETKRLSADWAHLISHVGLFPVAFGIVDSETDDNWLWFLTKLKGILSSRELSIITDRHTGLVKHVPEVFSNCYHAYCLEHLKNNLRDRLLGRAPNGFREQVVNLFRDCAHAPTVLAFDNCLKELYEKKGVDTSSYIDPFYITDAFRLSYELPIYPIPTLVALEVTTETAVIRPPKTRRPRGRPKVARIRSRGEKVRQIRCSRCKQLGKHNRKSCKEPCD
ncbi:hypothetical protein Vadar_014757 [Vaccinium darrowii]|uniref:Uncharacterized protein n=1 Tax=Vaccinium darrowii TaxID=229202 RepID=A0ACB7Z6D8_9ERIC|nr:hypothetical protein Vadar_014757 [Vaccinium darrowii]